MEDLISKISISYQNEKEKKQKNDSPQKYKLKNLADKIYVLTFKNIEGEQISLNKKKEDFSPSSFEGKTEKEMISILENNKIPIKYFKKVLKEIFKCLANSSPTKNKNKSKIKDLKLLLRFLEINKNKLNEVHILNIFNKIKDYDKENIDEIIKYIVINIKIDDKYFLELLKEEKIILSKNIIDSLNIYLNDINAKDKFSFINLVKTLNLISLVKEIINKEEYEKYEQKINKIFDEELNKIEKNTEICDKEFNEEYNIEFINSMKIINSNPNKAYYIQEKINI
jgi:hypothetical protein